MMCLSVSAGFLLLSQVCFTLGVFGVSFGSVFGGKLVGTEPVSS